MAANRPEWLIPDDLQALIDADDLVDLFDAVERQLFVGRKILRANQGFFVNWHLAVRLVQQVFIVDDECFAVNGLQPRPAVTGLDTVKAEQAACVLHGIFRSREIRAQVAAALLADVLRIDLRTQHVDVLQDVAEETVVG